MYKNDELPDIFDQLWQETPNDESLTLHHVDKVDCCNELIRKRGRVDVRSQEFRKLLLKKTNDDMI